MWDPEDQSTSFVLARVGAPVFDLLQRGVVKVGDAFTGYIDDHNTGVLVLLLHPGTYLVENVISFPLSYDAIILTTHVLAQIRLPGVPLRLPIPLD